MVQVIVAKGGNPKDFGLNPVDGGKFFEVEPLGENDVEAFKLDADRMSKLTKIIKFLERKQTK